MKLARKANISKAAWEALIPLEREIMAQPVEYGYQLTNGGKIYPKCVGTRTKLLVPVIEDADIFTHNHVFGTKTNNYITPEDIKSGVNSKRREVRAPIRDGFCCLVEIPKLKRSTKQDILDIVETYDILFKYFGCCLPMDQVRKMRKKLEKVGGLKFRTIKLPELPRKGIN